MLPIPWLMLLLGLLLIKSEAGSAGAGVRCAADRSRRPGNCCGVQCAAVGRRSRERAGAMVPWVSARNLGVAIHRAISPVLGELKCGATETRPRAPCVSARRTRPVTSRAFEHSALGRIISRRFRLFSPVLGGSQAPPWEFEKQSLLRWPLTPGVLCLLAK